MLRFALLLIMAACFMLPTSAKAQMTDAQKKEVEGLIKSYILENGDVVIEGVNKFQTKQQEEADKESGAKAKALIESLKKDKKTAFVGNPDGDVIVVEFFDYNCGYCKKAFAEIQQLLKDDKDVKIVLYDMPILGPESLESSKWAMAARNQGKYFEFHTALMNHQGGHNEESYKKLAKDAGLDADKLAMDKNDPAIDEELKSHIETAKSLNIQGTPGFLINEQIFRGYIPYDAMQEAIKTERAKLKK